MSLPQINSPINNLTLFRRFLKPSFLEDFGRFWGNFESAWPSSSGKVPDEESNFFLIWKTFRKRSNTWGFGNMRKCKKKSKDPFEWRRNVEHLRRKQRRFQECSDLQVSAPNSHKWCIFNSIFCRFSLSSFGFFSCSRLSHLNSFKHQLLKKHLRHEAEKNPIFLNLIRGSQIQEF